MSVPTLGCRRPRPATSRVAVAFVKRARRTDGRTAAADAAADAKSLFGAASQLARFSMRGLLLLLSVHRRRLVFSREHSHSRDCRKGIIRVSDI